MCADTCLLLIPVLLSLLLLLLPLSLLPTPDVLLCSGIRTQVLMSQGLSSQKPDTPQPMHERGHIKAARNHDHTAINYSQKRLLWVVDMLRCGAACRAEVMDGEVQVVGTSPAGQNANAQGNEVAALEDFEVPSQLRQQFIEVSKQTGLVIKLHYTGISCHVACSGKFLYLEAAQSACIQLIRYKAAFGGTQTSLH